MKREIKIKAMMVIYGIGLASAVPALSIFMRYFHTDDEMFYLIIGVSWLICLFFAFKLIGLWEKGNHLIYHDEESSLLNILQESNGDLVAFQNYSLHFIRKEFGGKADSEIYLKTYENDVETGFAKVNFVIDNDDVVSYSVSQYGDIKLPKNEVVRKFFGIDRRVLFENELKKLAEFGHIKLPGTIVYPLINDEKGLLGIWCLTIPVKIKPQDSPAIVFSSARYILENICTINYYKNRSVRADQNNSIYHSLIYNQIVNLVNIVMHELQTPIAIIKGELFMFRHTGKMKKESLNNIETAVERISSRVAKMAAYAETIIYRNSDEKQGQYAKKVIDIAKDLQMEYQRNLESIAKSKHNRVSLRIESKDAQQKEVICNSVVQQALYEIMENAVRYSNPGTLITVDITYRPRPTKNTVQFLFRNVGKIDPKVIEKFKITATAKDFENHSSTEGGIGIGLSLAHSAIAQAGGTMEIRTGENLSVIVDVDLPEA